MTAISPSTFRAWDGDLPEWLSPSLVKELRQALRSRIFVGLFLWVTCSMGLLLAIETIVVASSSRDARAMQVCEGCFWLNVGIVLSVLLPVRGLLSGMEELQPSSLDFQRLTGAEPAGVILSKWTALLGMSFLVVSSLLPFALLRYFFGGMKIGAEVLMLSWNWMGGLMFTSVALLLATLSLGARVFAGGITLLLMYPLLLGPSLMLLTGVTRDPSREMIPAVFWMPAAALVILLTLGGAAGRLSGDMIDKPSASSENEFHRW
jgi:hypothetical protein